MNKQDYINKHGNFWYYKPYDTWFNVNTLNFPNIDNVNYCILQSFNLDSVNQEHVTSTELFGYIEGYTIDEYHENYCKFDNDNNRWIFNK